MFYFSHWTNNNQRENDMNSASNNNILPFNHILALLEYDKDGVLLNEGGAAMEAAKVVAVYFPKAATFAVHTSTVDYRELDRVLFAMYSLDKMHRPGLARCLGLAIWPANPLFE